MKKIIFLVVLTILTMSAFSHGVKDEYPEYVEDDLPEWDSRTVYGTNCSYRIRVYEHIYDEPRDGVIGHYYTVVERWSRESPNTLMAIVACEDGVGDDDRNRALEDAFDTSIAGQYLDKMFKEAKSDYNSQHETFVKDDGMLVLVIY
jgi:hypothetical protein